MTPRLRRWLVVALVAHVLILVAGALAPYDPREQHRDALTTPPTRLSVVDAEGTRQPPFLLGTDAYGRDVWSRFVIGARTSIVVGLVGTAVAMALGLALGGLAGYAGGLADRAVMLAADVVMALPWLYLLLAMRALLPLDLDPARAFQLVAVLLASVGWARPARLVRGEVRLARQADYVTAARALGASSWRLALRHVLPAASGVLTTQAALLLPQFVLAEVTLSFLGLGVAEPAPSWGGLVAAAQRYDALHGAWWLLLPALALAPLCYIYYALADALQERLGGPRSA